MSRALRESFATPAPPGDRGVGARSSARPLLACVGLAVLSLALPSGLGYDPWAWLVWGRELLQGTFSTVGGPSWKPLPVLVTAPASLLGDAAPHVWVVVARAGGLFAMVLCYRLAARFAGPVAGAVAVTALVLSPDPEARWLRHLSQANIDPLTAGLCLWAVERHLDQRGDHALILLGLAGLSRPEAWPFLLLYSVWWVWRDRSRWWLAATVVLVVPVLWFGGDWLGAGDPWIGAARAQVLDESVGQRFQAALGRIVGTVPAPVWLSFAAATVLALRRADRQLLLLAAAAGVWMLEVGAMAVLLRYAALSRFLQPAVAVICVLAGIGAVRAAGVLQARAGRRLGPVLVVLVLVAAAPFVVARAAWLPAQALEAAERGRIDRDLGRLALQLGGREALLACGMVVIDDSRPALESQASLAWKGDLLLEQVRFRAPIGHPATAIVFNGGAQERLLAGAGAGARELQRTERWAAFAVGCPAPAEIS